jgi:hypothetical protein
MLNNIEIQEKKYSRWILLSCYHGGKPNRLLAGNRPLPLKLGTLRKKHDVLSNITMTTFGQDTDSQQQTPILGGGDRV